MTHAHCEQHTRTPCLREGMLPSPWPPMRGVEPAYHGRGGEPASPAPPPPQSLTMLPGSPSLPFPTQHQQKPQQQHLQHYDAGAESFHRVMRCVPTLQQHPPLAACAATYASLPPHHAPQAAVWIAVADYLAGLRRTFLAGQDLPRLAHYPPSILRMAVLLDVLVWPHPSIGWMPSPPPPPDLLPVTSA